MALIPSPSTHHAAIRPVIRRTPDDMIKRLMPLKNMLTPTSVPIVHSLLFGQLPQMMNAKSSLMIPSNTSHPDPLSKRSMYDSANSRIASTKRYSAIANVSVARPTAVFVRIQPPITRYTIPTRTSQSTAVTVPPRNAYTKCSTPLNSNSHPTIRVTATPATNGDAIAKMPAMIINTLSAMDHPVTRCTSD